MQYYLQLKNKLFSDCFIQGPLAGVSCAPFRYLTWQYSKPAFSCTEMISCKTLLYQPAISQRRFIEKHPQEGPVCFQLSGNDPVELGEAVKKVTDYGADIIDLNCGCPVKKIRSRGSGSKLLINPTLLFQLITAMKKNTTVPVSIKIRVENNNDEKFHEEIIKIIQESGLDFLVVHGRHWTEDYHVPCRYDAIQFFVENLKIPVIGNGDICNRESLQKMLSTGCAGVMISRAGVGQPWLINQLRSEMQNQQFNLPSFEEMGNAFISHIEGLIYLLNSEKFAILQARKLAKYYARHIPEKKLFCEEIHKIETLNELKKITIEYF